MGRRKSKRRENRQGGTVRKGENSLIHKLPFPLKMTTRSRSRGLRKKTDGVSKVKGGKFGQDVKRTVDGQGEGYEEKIPCKKQNMRTGDPQVNLGKESPEGGKGLPNVRMRGET